MYIYICIYVELMQGFNSASPSSSLRCRTWVTLRRDYSGYGSKLLRPREPQVLGCLLWPMPNLYIKAPWWGGSTWIIELCQWWFLKCGTQGCAKFICARFHCCLVCVTVVCEVEIRCIGAMFSRVDGMDYMWDSFGSGNQLGLSENSVPLHPMVNDHYPY